MPKETMKAVIYAGPGKYEIVDKEIPQVKKATDVLVKVLAASVCGTDVHILADPPEYPATVGTTIGHELVGEVVDYGSEVTGFQVGDRIIMDNNIECGVCEACQSGNYNVCPNMKSLGMEIDGAFAQYCVCPETKMVKINKDVPVENAIFAEPLNCVMGGIKKLKVMPGDSVLILGGGPIGMYFAEILKRMGAGIVAVSEMSEFRIEYLKKGSTDVIINPAKDDLDQRVAESLGGKVDIVIDCVGILLNDAIRNVKPGGTILLFGLNQSTKIEICQGDITRNGISVLGTFIGNDTLQTVAKGLNTNALNFEFMITHKLPLTEFGTALEAMRKGEALEVVLYPWEE